MISIPRRPSGDPVDAMAADLDRAGCLVVTDVVDAATRDRFVAELDEHMEAARFQTDDDPAAFYPARTRRVTALAARSRVVRDLIMHPTAVAMCEHFLRPNAPDGYQLHVTAALNVAPGARAQILHREEDPFSFFPLPRPNLIVATMWAISDFRAENGATLLVPGSHRWTAERQPTPDEIVAAEMPAGSVLFWLGGTLHGAGANVSDDWRYGVVLTYSAAWLRQEENQYLDVPPHVADGLSADLRRMLGFTMNGALGFHDPRVHVTSA